MAVLRSGARTQQVQGTYKDNALNRKLGRVGKTYTVERIVSSDLKGTSGGLRVDGQLISRARRLLDEDPIKAQAKAQRAFNAYWNKKLRAAGKGTPAERAVKAARARDIAFGRPKGLRNNTSYNRRTAGRLEYEGVDFGAKRYNNKAPTMGRRRTAEDKAAKRRGTGEEINIIQELIARSRARKAAGRA